MIVEFDEESFNRKWSKVYTVLKGKAVWIRGMDSGRDPDSWVQARELPYDDNKDFYFDGKVEYNHIKSGWYPGFKPAVTPVCLTRYFVKAFKAGVSVDTHEFIRLLDKPEKFLNDAHINSTNLLAPENHETEHYQIYKRRFLFTKTSAYYLTTKIGFVDRGLVRVVYKQLHQEVSDALKDSSCLKIS